MRLPSELLPNRAMRLIETSHPSFFDAIRWIYVLPLVLRKPLLSSCQTGLDASHPRLRADLIAAWKSIKHDPPFSGQNVLSKAIYFDLPRRIITSHMCRSLYSMLLRCCPIADRFDDSMQVLEAGIIKEVSASRREFFDDQAYDYSAYQNYSFNDKEGMSIEFPITPAWARKAEDIVGRFCSKVANIKLTFPAVQRVKNCSYETGQLMEAEGWSKPLIGGEELYKTCRTVDLEKWYHRTGVQIQGKAEMRWAWRFNDLKPRCYYTMGGELYWPSRYAKPIAVALMESFEMTCTKRRQNPGEVSMFLDPSELLVLWDLTSFTTTLSELRYFLFWIAMACRDNLRLEQNPWHVFDYRHGILELDFCQWLLDYNQEVNCGALYDVYRVADFIILDDGESTVMRQANSGMLGVPGNIGFSTALHGQAAAPATQGIDRFEKGAGIGDDGMVAIVPGMFDRFVRHIQHIGLIHPEKFEILHPVEEDQEAQVWKFVKRRIERYQDGFFIGELFDFAIVAEALAVPVPNRTMRRRDHMGRIRTFIIQICRMLDRIYELPHLVSDGDYTLFVSIVACWYRALNISSYGGIHPLIHNNDTNKMERLRLVVPRMSCDLALLDYRVEYWVDVAYTDHTGEFMDVPEFVPYRVPPPDVLYVGLEFTCTACPLIQSLEDLEYVEKMSPRFITIKIDFSTKHDFFAYIQRSNVFSVNRYRVLADVPEWFSETHDYLYSRSLEKVMYADIYTLGPML